MKTQLLKYLIAFSVLIQFNAIGQLIIEGDSIYCPGETITLNSKNADGEYLWSTSNNNLSISSPSSKRTSLTTSSPGEYKIKFEASTLEGNVVEDSYFDNWDTNKNHDPLLDDISFETTYNISSGNNGEYIKNTGEFRIDTLIKAWCSCEPYCNSPSYYKRVNANNDTTPRGNFMSIDGFDFGTYPSNSVEHALEKYAWQVSNISIKPNTSYTFSIDLSNWGPGTSSEVMILVNGIPLLINESQTSIYTVPSSCIWHTITGTWYSGNNSSATLTVSETGKENLGHELALDNISFHEKISKTTTSLNFEVYENCSHKNLSDTTVCKEKSILISNQEGITEINILSGEILYGKDKILISNKELGVNNIDYEIIHLDNQHINDPFFNNPTVFNTSYTWRSNTYPTIMIPQSGTYLIGNTVNGGSPSSYCISDKFHQTSNLAGDSIDRDNFMSAYTFEKWNNGSIPQQTEHAKMFPLWQQTITNIKPNTEYFFSIDVSAFQGSPILMVLFDNQPIGLINDTTTQNFTFSIPTLCNWYNVITKWNSGPSNSTTIKIADVAGRYGNGIAIDNILLFTDTIVKQETISIEVEDCIITNLEDQQENTIGFYPNPASDLISINRGNDVSTNIYNNSGKLIATTSESKINIGHFPTGLYIIEIVSGLGTERHKLIKQ